VLVMPRRLTQDDFFRGAEEILAKEGFHGLKQASLCAFLDVTTGSFYTHFASWQEFTSALLEQWQERRTNQLIDLADHEGDPIARLDLLRQRSTQLPHRAEAAIRVWSMIDPDVAKVQRNVDNRRLSVVRSAMKQLFSDSDLAEQHAHAGIYLLVGYESFEADSEVRYLDAALSNFLEMLKQTRDL